MIEELPRRWYSIVICVMTFMIFAPLYIMAYFPSYLAYTVSLINLVWLSLFQYEEVESNRVDQNRSTWIIRVFEYTDTHQKTNILNLIFVISCDYCMENTMYIIQDRGPQIS